MVTYELLWRIFMKFLTTVFHYTWLIMVLLGFLCANSIVRDHLAQIDALEATVFNLQSENQALVEQYKETFSIIVESVYSYDATYRTGGGVPIVDYEVSDVYDAIINKTSNNFDDAIWNVKYYFDKRNCR